jgi:signal transduction histidine kinase
MHPEDRQRCLEALAWNMELRQEFQLDYRLRRHDGEYRWVRDRAAPMLKPDGSLAGYAGSCVDIHDLKVAVEALHRGNAILIEAQEQERASIAQELHDEVGSMLAILGMDIMRSGQPLSEADSQKQAAETYQQLQQISSLVSRISHRLNPPMLKYMGLARAIQSECREIAEKQALPVRCICKDIPAKLDSRIAITLFRAMQEAVSNAAKHARANAVTVHAFVSGDELTIQVVDDGIGFDPRQHSSGLGLITTQERMRAIGGVVEIQSAKGQGTKVECRAPIPRFKATEK